MTTSTEVRTTHDYYAETFLEDDDAFQEWYRKPKVMNFQGLRYLSKEERENIKPIETVDLEQRVTNCCICMSWLRERLHSFEIDDYVTSMTAVHINDGHGQRSDQDWRTEWLDYLRSFGSY